MRLAVLAAVLGLAPAVSGQVNYCVVEPVLDFGFVIDSSRSISTDNYQKAIQFAFEIVSRLPVAENEHRVGFVSYGGGINVGTPATRLDFDLDDHFAKVDVQSAISFDRLGLLVSPPPRIQSTSAGRRFDKRVVRRLLVCELLARQ